MEGGEGSEGKKITTQERERKTHGRRDKARRESLKRILG